MISVLSLYDSSLSVSSSAMASSKAWRNSKHVFTLLFDFVSVFQVSLCITLSCLTLNTQIRTVTCVVLWIYIFGQLTGLIRWVEDLIVENGEIEGETETDWVCGLHFFFADVKGFLVGSLWVFNDGWEETKSMRAKNNAAWVTIRQKKQHNIRLLCLVYAI